MGDFVLTVVDQNRLYAITKKNRMITACFGVITLSQFALGTYLTAATAMEGGEPQTKWYCDSRLLVPQRNRSHRSHSKLIMCAFSSNIGT